MDSKTQRLIGEIESKVNHLCRILGNEESSAFLGKIETTPPVASGSMIAVVKNLLTTLEENEVYEEIVHGAIELSRAQRCFLMIMEDGSKLRWKGGFGLTQEQLSSSSFGGSRSIIKEVVKSGQPVLKSSSLGSLSDSMSTGSLLSALAVPILTGSRIKRSNSSKHVAGLIYVDSKGMSGEITAEVQTTLSQYADFVTLALENCWLYSESAGF